ncbi:hypothetical protein GCM10007108_10880 [Thermogymnomonas acidicola]|uniref:Uncharacterized protein n=1 Tax=Thermogymnomonas acidicola TaxID=399579 RepID=A0AA37BSD9_9ARCH|nr:hypothetical protein GCM10007108_10880 [Thermogymnomonas acidicola]
MEYRRNPQVSGSSPEAGIPIFCIGGVGGEALKQFRDAIEWGRKPVPLGGNWPVARLVVGSMVAGPVPMTV